MTEQSGGQQSLPRPNAEVHKWAQELAADVRRVLQQFPDADPDNVRHTLILLRMPPLERLGRSLLRGGARPDRS